MEERITVIKTTLDMRSSAQERAHHAHSLGIRIGNREVRERRLAIRDAQEKYLRECGYDPDQLRQSARALREQEGLCPHSDNVCEAADTPAAVCRECGKEKLRILLISPRPLDEIEPDEDIREAMFTDLLR